MGIKYRAWKRKVYKSIKYMSLDLDIISTKPVKHKGTGVYVRKDGEVVELKTIDEIKAYFPNIDLSNINEVEYETNTIWSGNITHNLGQMARNVPINDKTLYDYLWHPGVLNFKYVDQKYIDGIKIGYEYLKNNKTDLEKFNSPNGWGTYETLLNFTKSLNECLQNLIIEFSDDYTIRASI